MKRFKLIFFMSLMLLGLFSTCYAKTTLTDEEAEYLWNYFTKDTFNNEVSNNNYNNFYYTSSSLKKYSVVDYKSFQSYFNSTNEFSIDEHTYFFALFDTNILYIYWWNFNNTISGTLPYLYLHFNNDSDSVDIYAIDDNKNSTILKGGSLQVKNFYTGNPVFTSYATNTISQNGKTNVFKLNSKNFNVNNENYTNTFNPISGLTNFAKLPISVIYSNFDGVSYYGSPKSFFYKNLFVIEPDIPDEPSGDIGTGGTTGTITNPSGDTTGKVDLSGIEQGIGAVKDAVNNVTNTIKDAFTFDSGDANEVMEDFKNTDLGLSQDLYDLNNQFFDLFETQEMDDFVISWDGVNYQDIQLIPSGEVNFSALCRENEQIGKVKEYITLFAIVGSSLTLLKVIWNMISQMLGLNETLMETDFGDAKMYTYEDNSYDVDTRSYLDSKRYNRRR